MFDILPLLLVNGAWIASEAARELCQDIETARLRAGLDVKMFAPMLGLSVKQYSDQITLKHPLNVYRLADAPPVFWRHFLIVRAARVGLQVIEDSGLSDLVIAVQQLTGQKKMAKATLRCAASKECA